MSFLSFVAGFFTIPKASGSKSKRRQPPRRLEVEALEDRCLLSLTYSEVLGGASNGGNLLVLTGDDLKNEIFIEDRGGGSIGVWWDGEWGVLHLPYSEVRVSTGGGDDVVRYRLLDDLRTRRLVSVELGEGDDYFSATLHDPQMVGSDLLSDSFLQFRVSGGDGNDTMNVIANRDVDIARRAILSINFDGGGNNDVIGVFYNGELDGLLEFVARGGWGNDTVRANVTLDAGSTGALGNPGRPASIHGDGDDDELWFLLQDNSNGAAAIAALLADVEGDNEYNRTNNVQVIW